MDINELSEKDCQHWQFPISGKDKSQDEDLFPEGSVNDDLLRDFDRTFPNSKYPFTDKNI